MNITGDTTCPKCGRCNTPETNVCVCGCIVGWIRWCESVHDLRLAQDRVDNIEETVIEE